ncbi:PREDICTED: pentatricopeptide repeat-containing protein At1g10910, chloroplastic isoform X2 [Tarenaya hassleriana]|uniref:pentatricopeptide repeat-containing protein At1g10910, chloroplastic isoform X2 n=1 Tax=Tarenaya hassleriana TaxID=28532 RepID=UPI00053C76F4|nr:PREDICTED: pentatricopeptide repeat-containing protein At1g10910, chloroplastic isoform X2 [Tarenaya hassleriana]
MDMPVIGAEPRCPLLLNPKPSSSSSVSPFAVSAASLRWRRLLVAAATVAVSPVADLPARNAAANRTKRHSRFYLARKSAIAEVEGSPDFLSSLQRLERVLKVQDLNVILRDFGKSGRWQDLFQLFDWMQQHGKTNVATYSSYIKLVGGKSTSKAIEIYDSIPDDSTKANVYICNSLLSCLVKNGKFESSIKLFDKMKRDGLTPDVITYNTLLSGCIKVKNGYPKAMELMGELPHSGIQMDSVMYGTVLAVCASNGLCDEAQSFFKQMKGAGHSPNIYHYSSLLNAYSSNGDYKKADELVDEMKFVGLVPNKVIMTTLLKVYIRGGLFDRSRELLAELEARGYAEDEMPYCLLMDGFSKAGMLEEARSIFAYMNGKGAKSDGYAHSIIISALCRSELFEEAKELALDYEAKYGKCDLVMFNTMLCAYCRAGDMESVMRTMKKMDDLAISPDYNTFHILIKYFIKEKLHVLAYRTMLDMHSKGHRPDEELCSVLIGHLGRKRAHSEALSVYNMLRYSKRNICKAIHEKILHILIQGKLLKDAYIVVKDNAKLISKPAFRKFGRAFMKAGNINQINDVMKVMHGSGHKIDQSSRWQFPGTFRSQRRKRCCFSCCNG